MCSLGSQDLEAIAGQQPLPSPLAARLPTYLADVREKPSWLLQFFVLARTMAGRRLH